MRKKSESQGVLLQSMKTRIGAAAGASCPAAADRASTASAQKNSDDEEDQVSQRRFRHRLLRKSLAYAKISCFALREWEATPRDAAANPALAGVAQLVEQLIRNQQVLGSSPSAGSKCFRKIACLEDYL